MPDRTGDEDRPDDLDETPPGDHALIASIAALNAVPVVGGVLATFISEYVPRQKQKRLVEFVRSLDRELREHQDRLDTEFVRSADFSRNVEDVLDRVQTVRNEEKLGYWAALLAGAATVDRPSQRERERMIATLDAVGRSHLRLLHTIATTREARPGLYMGGMSDTLAWKMPDIPLEEVRRDWSDLQTQGLVQEFVNATMTREGAGNLTVRLTDYGRRFVSMLNLEAGFGA